MTNAVDQSLPTWPAGVSLLLGLGAQKAGTTWLHHRLREHPDCHAFPLKEVHYFDTINGQSRLGFNFTQKRLEALARDGNQRDYDRVSRLGELLHSGGGDHQGYIDLLTEGLASGSVALDVTPSYALLPDDQFAHLAQMNQVRFLFIMREPIARFWSGIRMLTKQNQGDTDGFERAAQTFVDRALMTPDDIWAERAFARSDYSETLGKLTRHVPADRRLVLFFEDLFSGHTMDRIWAFLDVSPMPLTNIEPRLEGTKASMRPDQIEQLKQIFRPQYEAVCGRFGDAVPAAWHARFASEAVVA